MNFAAFAAAQTAGQQINADLQAKRDDHELRQQQIASAKMTMSTQMHQQQQQLAFEKQQQQIIADRDATLQKQQVADGTSPDQQAEQQLSQHIDMYNQQAESALRLGLTSTAEQYSKLADTAQTKLTTTKKTNLEITEKRVKDAASFAGAVLDRSVTPQEAFQWVRENVGLKEALAIPTDPEKADLYWKSKQKMGISATEQVQAAATAEKAKADDKRARDFHRDQEEDKALQRQSLALQREELKFSRDQAHQDRIANLEERKRKDAEGGAIQRRQTIAAVNYANEAARGLGLVASMGATQTAGAFAHMQSPDTILKGLESAATNKLTPQDQQIYQTAQEGLGLELAQLATAGSGRAPVKDVINKMTQMVEARPGDTQLEVMFKLSNAADFAKTRLEAVPDSPDPKIQAIREKAEKELARYPHPSQIIALAMRKGVKLESQKRVQTLRDKLTDVLGASSDASAHPADVSDLLNKYK